MLFLFLSQSALAQLEPFSDYEISDQLWNITLVKVDPNMGDDYLEGLRDSWVASNRVAKELGAKGYVKNHGSNVEIYIDKDPEGFITKLKRNLFIW